MTLSAPGASDALDAHISYHLNAGVDAVIAAVDAPSDEVSSVLDSYVRGGRVHVVHNEGGWPADEWRARLARIAGTEYGADWIIDSDTDEFWWPRAESLADALLAIPPRYGVVQALVRRFLPASDDGPRVSRFTPSGQLVLGDWLRPVYRANSNLTLGPAGRGRRTLARADACLVPDRGVRVRDGGAWARERADGGSRDGSASRRRTRTTSSERGAVDTGTRRRGRRGVRR